MIDDIRASLGQYGLIRPRHGRLFGGVCAGLGNRIGLDPLPARLLFVLVLMLIPGSQILIYPALWILMPEEGTPAAGGESSGGGYRTGM